MEDDRSFYERRLKEELARAGGQPDAGLRALHRRWAGLYRERLARLAPAQKPLRGEEISDARVSAPPA